MRVFVSHAGRDRAWAEWAAWQIDHAGWDYTVELACWDWQAGDDFVARMDAALASCDRMLALFSQAYFDPTHWTAQEWSAAFRLTKNNPGFLVPVRIDNAPVPPLLAPLLAPTLHGLPAQQARATLLATLRPTDRPTREPPLPRSTAAAAGDPPGPRLPGVLPPVWGPIPARNEAFTGRDGMLVRLRESLQDAHRSVVYALHGAGGVGKTQLASQYARQFAGAYDAVWWVDAEDADRIGEQYTAFAAAWGLVETAAPAEQAVEALRAHCRSHDRWLVVLDNATNAHRVQPWRLDGPGHVVVTSRDSFWPEIATTIAVDVFTPSESIALLCTHLPALSDPDAARLADALGHLPLALAQAAGVITQTRMPVEEYLELLQAAPGEVLDEGTPVSYPRSLAKSLRVAHSQLEAADPAAAQLLTLCAFLAPDPIPTAWFPTAASVLPEPLAATVASRLAYRKMLGVLSAYGLIRFTADDRFTVHRLTQGLLRVDTPNRQHAEATVGRVLAGLTPGNANDPTSWPAYAELLPHLRRLDLAATDDARLARQAGLVAFYLLRRGEVHAGLDMITPLHKTWRDRLGPTADPTLAAADILAACMAFSGRPREGIAVNRELFDHYRISRGPDDLNTLTAASNLALRLADLGEHAQAYALAEDTLIRRRRVLGEDHRTTLAWAINFADHLANVGDHAQARALAEDTLTRCHRVLGEDHLDTVSATRSLAERLADLGEHEQARALAEDSQASYRRILGEDHPETLAKAVHLAKLLAKLGRHAQDRAFAEDTLARCRRILGEDNLDTLFAARSLADALAELGEHAQARALAADTVARHRRVLGEDHPDTLATANTLANALAELGEHAEARIIGEDTLSRARRVLGEDHPISRTATAVMEWQDRLGSTQE